MIKMIKPLIASALLAISLSAQAVGFTDLLGGMFGGATRGQALSVDDVLVKVSTQMNQKMPMAIDNDTRLDRVSTQPGRQFIYHYTLLSVPGADFNKVIKPQLKDRLCTNPKMQSFLKSGVTVSYLYRSTDGRPLGGAVFAPDECGSQS